MVVTRFDADLRRRCEVLVQLLERYEEFVDPQQVRDAGDTFGASLMPATYTPSVRELERLMLRLREERHSLWWHVNERYLACRTVTAYRCPKCKGVTHATSHRHRDKRGRYSTYQGVRVLVVRVSERVNPAKVERGVAWLADEWGVAHEPMLPKDARVAA